MPIYDFLCPHCKTTEEYFLNIKEDSPLCKKCHSRLIKLVSASHFKFKNRKDAINPNSFKTGHKQEPRLPINIVDRNADGSYKVTSTSKDPELING
jgi:putative FmdB family regulatory protein